MLACECHALGSARDDCEQTSGRCACRHGVRGDKCDACADSMIFAQDGTCIHGNFYLFAVYQKFKKTICHKFSKFCRCNGNCESCVDAFRFILEFIF